MAREATEFDEFSTDYHEALHKGLALSGERADYFAEGRVRAVARFLAARGIVVRAAMDYGCGTGAATRMLNTLIGAPSVVGVDVSSGLLDVARREHGGDGVSFAHVEEHQPDASVDLVYCNGVFHHILPKDRPAALSYIASSLRPGGVFALWENNPWNPGARMVMRRIPFDRDAILVSPPQARRLVREAGLRYLTTDYRFVFPHLLRALRPLEDRLASLPLGAQYCVLSERPD